MIAIGIVLFEDLAEAQEWADEQEDDGIPVQLMVWADEQQLTVQ